MDKYEFNIKVEQMKKMVKKGDYSTAMKIADSIDWRRVRNAGLLSMVAQIYENNNMYQEAKDILLLAFERAPIGKRLLFKLTELALKEGNIDEAESYYQEYCDLAQDDSGQYLLRYEILKEKGASTEQLIPSLERYTNEELDEKWMYELAELYSEIGRADKCISLCDRIMLMFGLGKYVDKAMNLKLKYAPLTKYQVDLVENRDKYEEQLRAVEEEYSSPAARLRRRQEEQRGDSEYSEIDRDEPLSNRPEHRMRLRNRQEKVDINRYAVSDTMSDDYIDDRYEGRPVVKVVERKTPVESESFSGSDLTDVSDSSYVSDSSRQLRQREDDELRVRFHEEDVEKELAEQMSKITVDDSKESMGETRIMPAIRRSASYLDDDEEDFPVRKVVPAQTRSSEVSEPVSPSRTPKPSQGLAQEPPAQRTEKRVRTVEESDTLKPAEVEIEEVPEIEPEEILYNHIMIEAETEEEGLRLAMKALKKIQEETGEKRQAAKISAEKLNQKGFHVYLPKLEGKNLIILDAARMNLSAQNELIQVLQNNESDMIVVLIDSPLHLEILHSHNPLLAQYFSYIGAEKPSQDVLYEEDGSSAAPKTEPEHKEESELEKKPEPVKETQTIKETPAAKQSKNITKPESAKTENVRTERSKIQRAKKQSEEESEEEFETEEAPVSKPMAKKEKKHSMVQEPMNETKTSRPDQLRIKTEQEKIKEQGVLSMNDFAKYACEYAKSIDCSIVGKSLLALYERVELMDADGVSLTREKAEDLIEEAADKAEKKTLGSLLSRIFSPKYDKDGKLILKEAHFIN